MLNWTDPGTKIIDLGYYDSGTLYLGGYGSQYAPDQFTFTSLTSQELATSVESNSIQVAGVPVDADVPIYIINGEYAVSDDGITWEPWRADASTVTLGTYVKVRHNTSAGYNTSTITTLFIGETSGTFISTTVVFTTTPVISLIGNETIRITQGRPFNDPGVSAYDANDGNLTGAVVITGNVNNVVIGEYTVTYTVTNSFGNMASVVRTVIVEALDKGIIRVNENNIIKRGQNSIVYLTGVSELINDEYWECEILLNGRRYQIEVLGWTADTVTISVEPTMELGPSPVIRLLRVRQVVQIP